MPNFVGFVRNASVYQKLGNPYIDEHVRRTRSQTGLELFDRQAGFQPVVDLLRSGGGVGVLSDQHAGDHGLWTPFFRRLASTSPLPALLAKRTRAAVIAAAVYTTGPARWRMVFSGRFDRPGASVADLTSKINEIIEHQIRVAPEDWFWVHNRWKTPQPNFLLARYKRGIHLPAGVSPNDLKPFRVLIRSSNWLGDAVMSVPAIRAIKHGRPDAHVTLATPVKIAPMWKLIAEVDAIIPLLNDSLFPVVSLLKRQSAFEVAILFPNSLRVALESWLSGISRRVGYRGHWRRWLVNQTVAQPRKPAPPEHHSLRFLRIARECRLVLTNDTGTMHLASLLGVPVVAIFGSTEPRLTGPLGNGHIVLRHHVECSPCFLRECPIDFRCMKAVSTQEAADAVLSILGEKLQCDT